MTYRCKDGHTDGRIDVRTEYYIVNIMTTYSAIGARWVNITTITIGKFLEDFGN